MRLLPRACLALLLLLAPAARGDYAFPIDNPYLATVFGTPPAVRAPVPDDIRIDHRRLRLFSEREIPSIFWHSRRFQYSVARQSGPAPLLFLIAGTGARYDSQKMVFLQKVFWQAGMHVVNITSPTQMDFIVTASASSVPGFTSDDARDLYAAMQHIWADLEDEIEVSEFYLSGYSLGGTQSAFVGHLDRAERVFDFQKILLINPSVSLYTSVQILDDMLAKSIPGGAADLERLINDLLGKVANYFHEEGRQQIDVELLFRVAETQNVTDDQLRSIVAAAFRISASNLLFTSDVMNGFGAIVPQNHRLGRSTSLTPYFKMSVRWTFTDYMDDVLIPHVRRQRPEMTRDGLIEASSLHSLRAFLRDTQHIGAITSRDELILAPEDLTFLEQTLGDRVIVYPNGGHCGNLMYGPVVDDMIEFFGAGAGGDE